MEIQSGYKDLDLDDEETFHLVGPGDALAIVDWDTPIVAPKERDLMFVGAGIGDIWREPWEADAFYRGYGPTTVDRAALRVANVLHTGGCEAAPGALRNLLRRK